ncbi:acyltransferase family protein [Erythrobacter sp. NE805]|uniref:acyltransferase family protein n=1 Tax=Erythrobacter sp. NE805 TaxID=3389875 RepID=UPI00396B3609
MRRSAPTLAALLPGRDNNLNLVRMLAAGAVLVSHAFPISGGKDPLLVLTGATGGEYAVAVFFGISGLLIARSFDRRETMLHFAAARVLRLFPALAVVLVLTVCAGALLTRLPLADYLAARGTWTYIPANLLLASPQFALPGVFETNPYGPQINGSLWTLFYEVACYGGVVLLGLIGVLRRRWLALAAAALVGCAHIGIAWGSAPGGPLGEAVSMRIALLARLAFPFMLGTAAYVWRERLVLSGWIALALWIPTALLPAGTLLAAGIVVALVYGALWFGFVPKGRLLGYNRIGDYSYGVYIYAFPVQQALVHFAPGMSPLANIVLALPATLVLAVLSWTLVERRAIAAARPLADLLTRRQGSDQERNPA